MGFIYVKGYYYLKRIMAECIDSKRTYNLRFMIALQFFFLM